MLQNQILLLDMAKAGRLALEAIHGLDEDAFGGGVSAMMAVYEGELIYVRHFWNCYP